MHLRALDDVVPCQARRGLPKDVSLDIATDLYFSCCSIQVRCLFLFTH